jgi:SPP1 gp7 family putative phage head morphogenesis protein
MMQYETLLLNSGLRESDVRTLAFDAYNNISKSVVTSIILRKESLQEVEARLIQRRAMFKDRMTPLMTAVFIHGAKKVMDSKGNSLVLKMPNYDSVIKAVVENNLKFVDDLTEFQKHQIVTRINLGIIKGQTYNEMAGEIVDHVKQMTSTRAQLIAQTEVSRAHATAQYVIMKENNIRSYNWVMADDNQGIHTHGNICEICRNLEKNSPYAMLDSSPKPVRDSHPRCRCVIVANIK